MADLGATEKNHCFGTICSVQRRIQRMYTSSLVSFDRSPVCVASCGIRRWVIHLTVEKQPNGLQKFTTGNRKGSIKSTLFQIPSFSISCVDLAHRCRGR
jgi:hypothetical protein